MSFYISVDTKSVKVHQLNGHAVCYIKYEKALKVDLII